jgi:hypothetical protein
VSQNEDKSVFLYSFRVSSALRDTNNEGSIDDVITIIEKVNLRKQQHQVLKIICNTYEISVSIYATSTSRSNEI